MSQSVREMNRQAIERRNQQGMKSLQENAFPEVRTLSEVNFIAHFLDTFAGDMSRKDEVLAAWATIAGDLSRPVHLTDAAGKIVRTVPPVTSTNIYTPGQHAGTSIDHEFMISRTGSMPAGEEYLYTALKRRFDTGVQQGDISDVEKQWVGLLTHYGKYNPGEVVNKNSTGDDIEFEY